MGKKISEKKIMIVDDDPDILVTLRTIFEKQHFEVLTVDSGSDCIKELEQGFKGIVLLDLMMPFMDGWDTIREIVNKGLHRNIVLSIITAKGSSSSDKMSGFEPFIYDYIPKPFDLDQLISEVNTIANQNN